MVFWSPKANASSAVTENGSIWSGDSASMPAGLSGESQCR